MCVGSFQHGQEQARESSTLSGQVWKFHPVAPAQS